MKLNALILTLVLVGCAGTQTPAAPTKSVPVFTDMNALVASPKLVVMRSHYRARSMNPFAGPTWAHNDVLRQAAEEGKDGVVVTGTGRQVEKNFTGSALYDWEEAISVEFVEPTVENVSAACAKLGTLQATEAASALRHAGLGRMQAVNPSLLAYLADFTGELTPEVLATYVEINQREAAAGLDPLVYAYLQSGGSAHFDQVLSTYVGLHGPEQSASQLSPHLIAYVKAGKGAVKPAIALYAQLNKDGGREELLRILKFHPSEQARTQAGIELAGLGARAEVEAAMREERDNGVREAVNSALL